VLCGRHHHPEGMLLSQSNSLQTQRLHQQLIASKPLQKSLWKQIVQTKIRHQAAALGRDTSDGKALSQLVPAVRSGDPTNVEAQAARKYWRPLLGATFRRDPEGPPPNDLLNYGYMAIRAAVARAICGAGLHPSLGLHHKNRGNAFCLADDLMEPLRPLVDVKVRELVGQSVKLECASSHRGCRRHAPTTITGLAGPAYSSAPLKSGPSAGPECRSRPDFVPNALRNGGRLFGFVVADGNG